MPKKRKLLSILLSFTLLFSTLAPLAAYADDDVVAIDAANLSLAMYFNEEQGLVDRWQAGNLLAGYPDGTLGLESTLTRAEFAAFLCRIKPLEAKADLSQYTDLKPNAWYSEPIAKAVAAGYLVGRSSTTMAPHAPLTYQEVVAVAMRLDQYKDLSADLDQDILDSALADVSDWARGAFKLAISQGFVVLEDGQLIMAAKKPVERMDLMRLLDRVLLDRHIISVPGTYELGDTTGLQLNTAGLHLKNTSFDKVKVQDHLRNGDVEQTNVTLPEKDQRIDGHSVLENEADTDLTDTDTPAVNVPIHPDANSSTSKPSVRSIELTAPVIVEPGNSYEVTAVVKGKHLRPKDKKASFSLDPATVVGVSLSAEGELVIADDVADGTTFDIVATARNKSARQTVKVQKPAPVITAVSIAGADAITAGEAESYTATVEGKHLTADDQKVTWSLQDGVTYAADTAIDATGKVTVAADETNDAVVIVAKSVTDGSKKAEKRITVNPPAPVIAAVSIAGADEIVAGGDAETYTATVTGEHLTADDQKVTWSLQDGVTYAVDTAIDANGKLTVAVDEANDTVVIVAKSVTDGSKKAEKRITVKPPAPVISKVTITGADTITAGEAETYTAKVEGEHLTAADQKVTWSLKDGVTYAVDTAIDANGKLAVAVDEANDTVVIVATSVTDNSKVAEKRITVKPPAPVISKVTIAGADAITAGEAETYTTTVTGEHLTADDQKVTWALQDGITYAADTAIDANGKLTVAADETNNTVVIVATSVTDNSKKAEKRITVNPPAPVVSKVTIAGADTITAGKAETYTATVTGEHLTADDQKVTWSLQDGVTYAVDTAIDANGKLTVAADEANDAVVIVATSVTDNSKTAEKRITVNPPAPVVSKVTITGADAITAGEAETYTAKVTGEHLTAADQKVTWSLKDGVTYATDTAIDATGKLTVAADEANDDVVVVATSVTDNSKKAEKRITVKPPAPVISKVTITGADTITAGEAETYTATVTGEHLTAADQKVTWSLGDGITYATDTAIDATGKLTVAADESNDAVVIVATSVTDNSKVVEKRITVKPPAPVISKVTIAGADTITAGEAETYTATVTGEHLTAADQKVTWSLGDGVTYATGTAIDANGKLTVAADEANDAVVIVATSVTDGSKVAEKTVTVNIPAPVIESIEITGRDSLTVHRWTQYTATVKGKYLKPEDQKVTWKLKEGVTYAEGTGIDEDGKLTVILQEQNKTITIIATSVTDNRVVAEKTIAIKLRPAPKTSELRFYGSTNYFKLKPKVNDVSREEFETWYYHLYTNALKGELQVIGSRSGEFTFQREQVSDSEKKKVYSVRSHTANPKYPDGKFSLGGVKHRETITIKMPGYEDFIFEADRRKGLFGSKKTYLIP